MGTTVDNQPQRHNSDEPAIWLAAMKAFGCRTAARLRHVADIVKARAKLWVHVGLNPHAMTIDQQEATIAAGLLCKAAWEHMGVEAKKQDGQWVWVSVNAEAEEYRILHTVDACSFRIWCLTVLDNLQENALSSAYRFEGRRQLLGIPFHMGSIMAICGALSCGV